MLEIQDTLKTVKCASDNITEIDFHTWPRTEHFDFFKNCLIPRYQICVELDATIFKEYTKKNALSFTLALTYIVARCATGLKTFVTEF